MGARTGRASCGGGAPECRAGSLGGGEDGELFSATCDQGGLVTQGGECVVPFSSPINPKKTEASHRGPLSSVHYIHVLTVCCLCSLTAQP